MACDRGWPRRPGGLWRWSCGPGSRVSSHIPPTMATNTMMPVTIKARKVPVVMTTSGPPAAPPAYCPCLPDRCACRPVDPLHLVMARLGSADLEIVDTLSTGHRGQPRPSRAPAASDPFHAHRHHTKDPATLEMLCPRSPDI